MVEALSPRSTKIEAAAANLEALGRNTYPGRGIAIGFNRTGTKGFEVYWVMGRSEQSRNRRLELKGDVVRTVPLDPSRIEDPSLIIYNAMRIARGAHVVSNGDQTDDVVTALLGEDSYDTALLRRTFEPDGPNFTPRITGILFPQGDASHFVLSTINKESPKSDKPAHVFYSYGMESLRGFGRVIHTYAGNGNPVPAMRSKPYIVPLDEHIGDVAATFWGLLNPDNRVAMVVKSVDLGTGDVAYRIANRYGSWSVHPATAA